MTVETNHSLSVDCVIFGYDNEGLKVLLVEQKQRYDQKIRFKLPGSMILEDETIPEAAQRVLLESTGLERVYLKQTNIFSDPNRVEGEELEWIARSHNITTRRVVTVGLYALVRITGHTIRHTRRKGAVWHLYESIPKLAMDHTEILKHARGILRRDFEYSPIAFELLPRKFTIRELHDLYSAVMGVELDKRNFRKKILKSEIVKPTGERQSGVAHKPAEFYTFNKTLFEKRQRNELRYL